MTDKNPLITLLAGKNKKIMDKIPYPLSFISGVGFIMSAIANIGSLVGMGQLLGNYIWVLHFGIFIVFFPASLLFFSRFNNAKNLFGNWLFEGCPKWMSRAVPALFCYAILTFFISEATGSQNFLYFFSGLWLFFYGTSFAISYSKLIEIKEKISQPGVGEGREEARRP